MLEPLKWIDKYGDYLYSIAFFKTNSHQTAEDLIQDTFLSAFKNQASFAGEASEKTWLVSILNNKIIDYYRKKNVLKNTSEYLTETEDAFNSHFFESDSTPVGHWKDLSTPNAWDTNSDFQINESDFQRILAHCISLMPKKIASVFIAKFIDGCDSEKICKDYEISSSNYWVIIHRSKLLMRSCLENKWLNA